MAAPELRDYRGRISVLADVLIDAESKACGKERQELVREILDKWADERLHAMRMAQALLIAEGMPGIESGVRGIEPETCGSARNSFKAAA